MGLSSCLIGDMLVGGCVCAGGGCLCSCWCLVWCGFDYVVFIQVVVRFVFFLDTP